jgi:hypothetical protein
MAAERAAACLQARLVRIVAGYQLGLAVEEVEARLAELEVVLPQLAARCAAIKPSTLAALLREPGALVARLLSLRQLLPGADIGALAADQPELLLLRPLGDIDADLQRLRGLLGPHADVQAAVQRQPRLLDAELVRCGCLGGGRGGLRVALLPRVHAPRCHHWAA